MIFNFAKLRMKETQNSNLTNITKKESKDVQTQTEDCIVIFPKMPDTFMRRNAVLDPERQAEIEEKMAYVRSRMNLHGDDFKSVIPPLGILHDVKYSLV